MPITTDRLGELHRLRDRVDEEIAREEAAQRRLAEAFEERLERLDQAVVRRWARRRGMTIGGRGRLPRSVLEAYAKAHP